MGIEQVANKYKKTDSDPAMVWANAEMDADRRTNCLCFNCDRKNEESPYASCPVAGKMYALCKTHNMAMAVTRCGATSGQLSFTKFYIS